MARIMSGDGIIAVMATRSDDIRPETIAYGSLNGTVVYFAGYPSDGVIKLTDVAGTTDDDAQTIATGLVWVTNDEKQELTLRLDDPIHELAEACKKAGITPLVRTSIAVIASREEKRKAAIRAA